MTTPAQLIAANLAALPHPDGTPRQLAGYNRTLLPEPLQAEVDKTAADIGESIIWLLEQSGWAVVPADQAAEPAATQTGPPVAHLHCTFCDTRLLSLNIADASHARTDGAALITGLTRLTPECPHRAAV